MAAQPVVATSLAAESLTPLGRAEEPASASPDREREERLLPSDLAYLMHDAAQYTVISRGHCCCLLRGEICRLGPIQRDDVKNCLRAAFENMAHVCVQTVCFMLLCRQSHSAHHQCTLASRR